LLLGDLILSYDPIFCVAFLSPQNLVFFFWFFFFPPPLIFGGFFFALQKMVFISVPPSCYPFLFWFLDSFIPSPCVERICFLNVGLLQNRSGPPGPSLQTTFTNPIPHRACDVSGWFFSTIVAWSILKPFDLPLGKPLSDFLL